MLILCKNISSSFYNICFIQHKFVGTRVEHRENRSYSVTINKAINSHHWRKEGFKRKGGKNRASRRMWLNVVEEINGPTVYIKTRTVSLRINDINKINLGIPGLFIIRLKYPVSASSHVPINNDGKSHFLGRSFTSSTLYLFREKTRI